MELGSGPAEARKNMEQDSHEGLQQIPQVGIKDLATSKAHFKTAELRACPWSKVARERRTIKSKRRINGQTRANSDGG